MGKLRVFQQTFQLGFKKGKHVLYTNWLLDTKACQELHTSLSFPLTRTLHKRGIILILQEKLEVIDTKWLNKVIPSGLELEMLISRILVLPSTPSSFNYYSNRWVWWEGWVEVYGGRGRKGRPRNSIWHRRNNLIKRSSKTHPFTNPSEL